MCLIHGFISVIISDVMPCYCFW